MAKSLPVWLTLLGWATSLAQQPPQTAPVFRSGIDLVHFDVSVLDKDRHPVRGLTASDFVILEDGKPQTIAAFLAVDVPPVSPPRAKWQREVSSDVTSNEGQENPEGRLFVLLIDDAMLPADPAAIQNAKKIGRSVVDRLSATDQMAVVFSFGSGNAQTFTNDRRKLLAAIDALQTGPASHLLGWENPVPPPRRVARPGQPLPSGDPVPGVDSDIGLRLASLRTLQMVAESLIAAPQRRKALIFVSPGVTLDVESDVQQVRVVAGESDPGTVMREANHQLAVEAPKVFAQMARANVTLYAVDPCGLGGLESYVAGAAGSLPVLRSGRATTTGYNWLAPDFPPRPSDLGQHVAKVDLDFLVAAAANTGGRTIVNTNNFDPGLDGIFDKNSSYYLLGYMKPEKNTPGSAHRVTVKVNRPGVTVRTRSGYDSEGPGQSASKEPVASALEEAASHPVAGGALPLQIALAPVAVPDPDVKRAQVTIVLGLRQAPVDSRTSQTVDLQVGVFTPDGRRVGPLRRQTATFKLLPVREEMIRYELLAQIEAIPGRYEVRVAAHRESDGLTGSVYADVVVPDFSKAPLSLSGVWIEANPGPSAIPREALKSLLPIVPTASREFRSGDDATAFFRVYQGGNAPIAPVALTVGIINDHDVTIATATGMLGVERFDPAARSADHRFVLPLRGLPAGQYLLTFNAALGPASERRDVVFTVR